MYNVLNGVVMTIIWKRSMKRVRFPWKSWTARSPSTCKRCLQPIPVTNSPTAFFSGLILLSDRNRRWCTWTCPIYGPNLHENKTRSSHNNNHLHSFHSCSPTCFHNVNALKCECHSWRTSLHWYSHETYTWRTTNALIALIHHTLSSSLYQHHKQNTAIHSIFTRYTTIRIAI